VLIASAVRADDPPVKLGYPIAVAAGADGSIFIADYQLRAIIKRDAQGSLSILARSGPKDRTPLRNLKALAADPDGAVLAADSATREIYRVAPGQQPKALTGGSLEIPVGVAVDKDGTIVVCDRRLGSVLRIPKEGGTPAELARVPAPAGVLLAGNGDIIVLSSGPDQIVRVNAKGEVSPIVKGKPFKYPLGIAGGQGDTAYVVSDGDAAALWAVGENGAVRPLAQGAPLKRPEGLAREPSGALLVADAGANQIFRLAPGGKLEPVIKGP
jgi:sugar lactone lactonase YvrE